MDGQIIPVNRSRMPYSDHLRIVAILSVTFLLSSASDGSIVPSTDPGPLDVARTGEFAHVFREPVGVVGIAPAAQSLNADPLAPIVISFSDPIDRNSINAESVMIFGRWSGVANGTFQFENGDRTIRFSPGRAFSAGEKVTVSISSNLRTTNGSSFHPGYAWQYWIRTLPGSMDLRVVSRISVRLVFETEQIQTYGAYAGDLNGDGYPDLAVPNERTNDLRVFVNDGSGNYSGFTVYSIPGGARPSPNEGADFDLDGQIDLVVGNSTNNQLSLFMGIGDGTFESVRNFTGDMNVRGVTVLDADFDGWPDVATANRIGSGNGSLSIYLNDAGRGFAIPNSFDGGGLNETAIEAADVNEDGILDLVVGALKSEEILVWTGDGDGGFTFRSRAPAGGRSWMIATGDLNGDGHVDIASANSRSNHASVLFGDGTGAFSSPEILTTGLFPLAIDLGDLDADGDLDLVTSNFSSASWTIYENAGDGSFLAPRTLQASDAGSCAVLVDRDRNGSLDMIGIDEVSDELFVFDNNVEVTGTNELPDPTRFADFDVFPNPTSRSFSIRFENAVPKRIRIQLFDLLGRRVGDIFDGFIQATASDIRWTIPPGGSDYPAGLYIIRASSGRHIISRPIVLSRTDFSRR